MEYWIAINRERKGPLSLEGLRNTNITPDTLVWREGLASWVKAEDLEELAWLFSDEMPPAVPTTISEQPIYIPTYEVLPQPQNDPLPAKPRSYIGWSIAAILLCCAIPAIVALVKGSKVDSRYIKGDYEGAKKASESAELWLIISIVAGLVWMPFSVVLQFLGL